MTGFVCDRCHYSTEYLSNFKRHLTKKHPCAETFSSKTQEELLAPHTFNKSYVCKECSKGFTSAQGRRQHRKHCKGAPSCSTNTGALLKMVANLCHTNQPATIHNTIIQNTQHNNIQVINAFGREDTSHLNNTFLNTCLRRTSKGFVQLLEKLHWDPAVPGNANIRISNRKAPLAEVQQSGKWHFVPRDKAINQMIDKGQGILSEHFEDHQEELKANMSDSLWDHIAQWMEKMQDKDKSTIQDLLLEIYCLILNNS